MAELVYPAAVQIRPGVVMHCLVYEGAAPCLVRLTAGRSGASPPTAEVRSEAHAWLYVLLTMESRNGVLAPAELARLAEYAFDHPEPGRELLKLQGWSCCQIRTGGKDHV